MRKTIWSLAAVLLLLWGIQPPAAAKQTSDTHEASVKKYLEALAEADAATTYVWQEMPFVLNKALLVAKPCKVYGAFEPRGSNILRDNDPLLIYLEPIGFKYNKLDEGFFEFGVAVDVLVMDSEGKIVLLKDAFRTETVRSRYRIREYFLNLNLPLFGLMPGQYYISLKIRDIVGKGETTAKIAIIVR